MQVDKPLCCSMADRSYERKIYMNIVPPSGCIHWCIFVRCSISSLGRIGLVVVLQVRSSTNYHGLIGDFILFNKEYVQSKQLEISNREVLLTANNYIVWIHT